MSWFRRKKYPASSGTTLSTARSIIGDRCAEWSVSPRPPSWTRRASLRSSSLTDLALERQVRHQDSQFQD